MKTTNRYYVPFLTFGLIRLSSEYRNSSDGNLYALVLVSDVVHLVIRNFRDMQGNIIVYNL